MLTTAKHPAEDRLQEVGFETEFAGYQLEYRGGLDGISSVPSWLPVGECWKTIEQAKKRFKADYKLKTGDDPYEWRIVAVVNVVELSLEK